MALRNTSGAGSARVAAVLFYLPALIFLSSCQNRTPPEPVSIGEQLLEFHIPIALAEERQLFARNGLKVAAKGYDTGRASTEALLAGEVDVAASVSDYVLVSKAMAGMPIQTFASYGKSTFISIVARKDKGLQAISDLRGKRIGVLKGTNLEFYLGRFLELHGILLQNVIIVDTKTWTRSKEAIENGAVDAIVTGYPYTEQVVASLGDVVVWPAQSSQPVFVLLLARSDWLAQHGTTVQRLLRAIAQAEDYMVQNPAAAKAFVARRLGFSPDYVTAMWRRNLYTLSLDQALVSAMEDQARWMMANHRATATRAPDVMQWIYSAGLSAVQPTSVNLVR